MADKKDVSKSGKEQKKIERLSRLSGIDMCACIGGDQKECEGLCRERHINIANGKVECGEMYRIDCPIAKKSNTRNSKRNWKYGRQKEVDENKLVKQHHRDKRERDKSK